MIETKDKAKEILKYFNMLLSNHGENILLKDKKLHKDMLKEIEFMIDND